MSLSKALGRFPGMEPVAGGCGLGCAVFTSSSSIPETRRGVGLFLSIICGVSTVYSSLRPQHSLCLGYALFWNHSRERQACPMPTYHSLRDTHCCLTQTIWPKLLSPECRAGKLPRYSVPLVLQDHAHTQQGSSFSPSLSF